MSQYAIAVTTADRTPEIIKLLRRYSTLSVAELLHRLGTVEQVVMIDTHDFALELPPEHGVVQQQQKLLAIIDALEQAGARVLVTHHVGALVEPLSREMLVNLFESELIYLQQEHD